MSTATGTLYTWNSPEVGSAFYQSDWYKKNHFTELKYDSDEEVYYEAVVPLYVWTEIVPRDPSYYEIVPASLWTKASVKEDKKNPNKRLDAKGYPLPKTGKYINDKYNSLSTSGDATQRIVFDFLNKITDHYLKSQEAYPQEMRLGYALPKIEEEHLFNKFSEKGIMGGVKNMWQEFWTDNIASNPRDIERGFTVDDETVVRTDLADLEGTEFQYIPVRLSSAIDISNQSYDVAGGVLQYTNAADIYSTLEDIHTEADAFQTIFREEGVTTGKTDAIAAKNARTRAIATAAGIGLGAVGLATGAGVVAAGAAALAAGLTTDGVLSNFGIKKKGESNREVAAREFVKMVFYGEYKNTAQIGKTATKVISSLLRWTGFTTLALNLPADAVNYLDAKMELLIEQAGKETFGADDSKEAQAIFRENARNLYDDTWKEGQKSILGQLIAQYDVIQGEFEDELGHNLSITKVKRLFSDSPLFFLEI